MAAFQKERSDFEKLSDGGMSSWIQGGGGVLEQNKLMLPSWTDFDHKDSAVHQILNCWALSIWDTGRGEFQSMIFEQCSRRGRSMIPNTHYSMFSQKWVFDKMGFSRILEISQRVVDFPKIGFRRNGFFFWASNFNTQKLFIFTREFLTIFDCLEILLKNRFSRILDARSNSQKWVFEEMCFSERLLRTKARKMVTIFARTYCTCSFAQKASKQPQMDSNELKMHQKLPKTL